MENQPMNHGALVRPRDPAEDKYRRLLSAPAPTVADLTQPRTLLVNGKDPRPAVFNQGNMGSCAACGSAMAVETVHNVLRLKNGNSVDAKSFNPAPVYYKARIAEGWFPTDSGSYIGDDLDLLMGSSPLISDGAYSDDSSKNWSAFPWHTEVDYELQHQPFYPGDGNTLEHIWNALDQGCALVQGGYWSNDWYRITGGKLPAGTTNFLSLGHAYYLWNIVPGFVLATNSWGSWWTQDAAEFGFGMRPGDFAIPWEYYTRANTPFWEWRVITPEPVSPQPPDPPDPNFVSFDGIVQKAKTNKVTIIPNQPVLKNIAGRQIRAIFADGSFNGTVKSMESNWIVVKPTSFNQTWNLNKEPIHIETI